MHRQRRCRFRRARKIQPRISAHKIEIDFPSRPQFLRRILSKPPASKARCAPCSGESDSDRHRLQAASPAEIPFDDKFIFIRIPILTMEATSQEHGRCGRRRIGCEYVSIFTAMGVAITLVDLPRSPVAISWTREISDRLARAPRESGPHIFLPERPKLTARTRDRHRMTFSSGKGGIG